MVAYFFCLGLGGKFDASLGKVEKDCFLTRASPLDLSISGVMAP